MRNKTSRGRGKDRSKVAGGQDYEVQYEKDKMGVSGKELKHAVKSEGNQRKKVEKKLGKQKIIISSLDEHDEFL